MHDPVRLVLVDDHALIREGIRASLLRMDKVSVVGEAGTAAEALAVVEQQRPDLVLLDIALPDASGLDLARHLLEEYEHLRVLVLSMHDDEEYVRQAVHTGVHGYVLKDMAPDQLVEAIRTVAAGDVYFPPAISRIALRVLTDRPRPDRSSLTPRERQVLALLAAGCINKEIADQLSLSVRTVETYRGRLMKKLDIHTVAGLTRYAIAEGIIPPR